MNANLEISEDLMSASDQLPYIERDDYGRISSFTREITSNLHEHMIPNLNYDLPVERFVI